MLCNMLLEEIQGLKMMVLWIMAHMIKMVCTLMGTCFVVVTIYLFLLNVLMKK